MEVLNLIVNIFVAIGTIGACVVSIILASKKKVPNVKILASSTQDGDVINFTLNLYNYDENRPITIKELGFPDKINKEWINVNQVGNMICQKRCSGKTIGGNFLVIHANLNETLKYGEELCILLYDKVIEKLLVSTKGRKAKIAIILIGEQILWLKISKRKINQLITHPNCVSKSI